MKRKRKRGKSAQYTEGILSSKLYVVSIKSKHIDLIIQILAAMMLLQSLASEVAKYIPPTICFMLIIALAMIVIAKMIEVSLHLVIIIKQPNN
jgi:hypothetical protein